jgi:hypothetical protein
MAILTTAGLASVLAQPATAAAGPVRGAAFVWASEPTTLSYKPPYPYSENSSAQPSLGEFNSITRSGVGSYTIRHLNLGIGGGTVHVTAYGPGTAQCKVVNWYPSGADQLVNVKCHTLQGAPVDTQFTESYTNLRSTSTRYPLAYLWADQPTSASYVPFAGYQSNPSGALNRITRASVGSYTAFLPNLGMGPNLGVGAGHVEVTAYGSDAERCKVVSWGPSGSDQAVRVKCFTVGGQPVDTQFTLTYASGDSILDLGSTYNAAYGWANNPTSASYTLIQPYTYNTNMNLYPPSASTARRLGVGDYATNYPVGLQNGNVQVTAYGIGSGFCKVAFWNSTDGIRVRCYNASGALTDTQYDIAFAGIYSIP